MAAKLGSDRATAKVAVLAAMYGQRSGAAGRALGDLERAYPVAMAYLDAAYRNGVTGRSVRTFGGRLIRAALPPDLAGTGPAAEPTDPVVAESPGAAGGRGRYLRNAVIQGAAAELFKAWAATVRHVVAGLDGRIVLCLHDELLVHVPEQHAEACAGACRAGPRRQRPALGPVRSGPLRGRHLGDPTLVRGEALGSPVGPGHQPPDTRPHRAGQLHVAVQQAPQCLPARGR